MPQDPKGMKPNGGFRMRLVAAAAIFAACSVAAASIAAQPAIIPSQAVVGGKAAMKRFARVEVPPLRSSFFLGIVSLVPGVFERTGASYHAAYRASILGFFYREHGTVEIDIADDSLLSLKPGTRLAFTGRAKANDGGVRRISGFAEANDAASGRIQIRIAVTKSIELSFVGPYRFKEAELATEMREPSQQR